MTVRFLPAAREELLEAAEWYEQREPGLGQRFLTAVTSAVAGISETPQRFPRLSGYSGRREIRRRLVSRFPYALIYENRTDEAIIVAVAHGSRRPGYWRRRSGEAR